MLYTALASKLIIIFVFCSGLRNDHIKEVFNVKHELDAKMFPCNFIKIGE